MSITNGYTTLASIKARCNITSIDAKDDAFLEDCVEAASRFIDNQTGHTFYARTETHYYDTPRYRALYIEDDDLLSISRLTNGDASTIASAEYKTYPLNGTIIFEIRLLGSSDYSWEETSDGDYEGAISILGSWGFSSTTPEDIREACEAIVVGMYKRRTGEFTEGVATVTGAGVVIQPNDVPPMAWRIIKNYQRLA